MRTDVAGWLGLVIVGLSAGGAVAQPERYELGQRLKRFEQAWEEQKDPAARKKALAVVKKASGQFLSLQLGEAGRTLDEARYALRAEPPSDTERWLDSLFLEPDRRLVDGQKELLVTVRTFYTPKVDRPAERANGLVVEVGTDVVPNPNAGLRFGGSMAAPERSHRRPVQLNRLPAYMSLPHTVPPAQLDWRCWLSAHDRKQSYVWRPCVVSTMPDLDDHIATWRQITSRAPDKDSASIEAATIADHAASLLLLAEGQHPEIDLPAARMTDQAGTMAQLTLIGKPYFTSARVGDFRLSVPTGKSVRTPCRLLMPKYWATDKPVPLVVALHGAGGSENLFFEGYGNGHIVKECEKRGWLLLSPRSGLIGAAPVAAIIDKLAERYPIDPNRIFLVGHSMGAGQAIELAQQHPGKFSAVASLGGAGRVRKKEPFADLPVFVGVGDQDFALKGSRALHKALTDAGAKRVTYKEYPDLEHLVIVREALPDVFAAWDEIAKK